MTVRTDEALGFTRDASVVANTDRRTVTVWSDIGCPWATLALHTLRTAALERAQEVLIDDREFEYPVTTLPAMEAVQAAKNPVAGGLPASDELDAALRRAFYVDGRCISINSVILDIAEQCKNVDVDALAAALARGDGRAEVYDHWKVAQGPEIQGSPHLFTAGGFAAHNPGANYHWTAPPGEGFPRLEHYSSKWANTLLDGLTRFGE